MWIEGAGHVSFSFPAIVMCEVNRTTWNKKTKKSVFLSILKKLSLATMGEKCIFFKRGRIFERSHLACAVLTRLSIAFFMFIL